MDEEPDEEGWEERLRDVIRAGLARLGALPPAAADTVRDPPPEPDPPEGG